MIPYAVLDGAKTLTLSVEYICIQLSVQIVLIDSHQQLTGDLKHSKACLM